MTFINVPRDIFSKMHVVSWNVAGFRTTYDRIKFRFGGIRAFMQKLRCDILCLQEVKLGEDQITFDSIEQKDESLDFFFSWSGKKNGVNGVATIARRGLTLSATRALGGPVAGTPHDSTGRFLQTDHGDFVLLNLYVHNDGREEERQVFVIHDCKATTRSMFR
jgi:exonuclease III